MGAVRQASSTNFTLLSFSSATQRQFAGEPTESAPALTAVLIAEYAEPSLSIPAQPVRAKQSEPLLIRGLDRLLIRHRSPDQPINILHRLDPRLDDPHLNSFTTSLRYLQRYLSFMTQ